MYIFELPQKEVIPSSQDVLYPNLGYNSCYYIYMDELSESRKEDLHSSTERKCLISKKPKKAANAWLNQLKLKSGKHTLYLHFNEEILE